MVVRIRLLHPLRPGHEVPEQLGWRGEPAFRPADNAVLYPDHSLQDQRHVLRGRQRRDHVGDHADEQEPRRQSHARHDGRRRREYQRPWRELRRQPRRACEAERPVVHGPDLPRPHEPESRGQGPLRRPAGQEPHAGRHVAYACRHAEFQAARHDAPAGFLHLRRGLEAHGEAELRG